MKERLAIRQSKLKKKKEKKIKTEPEDTAEPSNVGKQETEDKTVKEEMERKSAGPSNLVKEETKKMITKGDNNVSTINLLYLFAFSINNQRVYIWMVVL